MPDDSAITQDAGSRGAPGRLSIALSVGGMLALLSAGALWGSITTEVSNLRADVSAIRIEVQTRESKDAVQLMFGDLRARLSRIESLLDRSAAPNSPQRIP